MILTQEISTRLAMAIKKKGTTPYKVAKALKISASTIGNYLDGNVDKPDDTKLKLVCDFLGINLYWLETGKDMVTEDTGYKNSNTPTETNTTYQIEQIFLKLQARDDQFLNLHKDMGNICKKIENLSKEVGTLREEITTLKAAMKKLK